MDRQLTKCDHGPPNLRGDARPFCDKRLRTVFNKKTDQAALVKHSSSDRAKSRKHLINRLKLTILVTDSGLRDSFFS